MGKRGGYGEEGLREGGNREVKCLVVASGGGWGGGQGKGKVRGRGRRWSDGLRGVEGMGK